MYRDQKSKMISIATFSTIKFFNNNGFACMNIGNSLKFSFFMYFTQNNF